MTDEYTYPQARNAAEYCLRHNLKLENFYGECPVCYLNMPLLVSEEVLFDLPPHFRRLSIFYENIALALLTIILIDLLEFLYYPVAIFVMIFFSWLFHRISEGIMTLHGIGYNFLGLFTGLFATITMFSFMITLDVTSVIVPGILFSIFAYFSYYMYSSDMVRAIVALPDHLKQKLVERDDWYVEPKTRLERVRQFIPGLILPLILVILNYFLQLFTFEF